MSKLGSRSHSINPDVLTGDSAAGLKGDKGDVGDVGAAGTNGTNGAAGTNGVIDSIVAGTNITVDASDPANPVVASTASGGSVQLEYESRSVHSTLAASSSSNATKGTWLTIGSSSVEFAQLAIIMTGGSTDTYRLIIIEEDAVTPFEVAAVIGTSLVQTFTANNQSDAHWVHFEFSSTITLETGKRYCFGLQRTDGTGSAACNAVLDSQAQCPSIDFIINSVFTLPSNTIPSIGDDWEGSQTALPFQSPFKVRYTRS
ncbi:MAG: hypothetical protein V3S69_05340 [Dehalococcoidales bacterium]